MDNVTIAFNPKVPEDCKRAVTEMKWILCVHLGLTDARRILSEATPSRRFIGAYSNVRLMARYVAFWKRHRISVRVFAAAVAKKNSTLPRDARIGPRGSTNPEALEKQIRREKKRAAKDPTYRKLIASIAETYRQSIDKQFSGDISKQNVRVSDISK